MAKVYAIRDVVANCDVTMFISDNNGTAKTSFKDFCEKRKSLDFELHEKLTFDFGTCPDTGKADSYFLSDMNAAFVCSAAQLFPQSGAEHNE